MCESGFYPNIAFQFLLNYNMSSNLNSTWNKLAKTLSSVAA
jgi:hypothetical protein